MAQFLHVVTPMKHKPAARPTCNARYRATAAEFSQGETKKAGQRKNVSALSMVPGVGIEPTHLSVLDFESSASTNSTTRALIREPELWHSVGYEISNH